MDTKELRSWLRLILTPSVGNDTARRLLSQLGSVEAIFEASEWSLSELVTPAQVQSLCQPPALLEAHYVRTTQWLSAPSPANHATRAIWPLGHPLYPASLLHLADPPLLLFVEGQTQRTLGPAIAVVGSRNPTPQGRQTAQQLSRALADAGLCVVSGMALGIDGASHQGALQSMTTAHAKVAPALCTKDKTGADTLASLETSRTSAYWKTVGVVGTGLDHIYPRHHQALAQEIGAHGLLISEYLLGTPPLAANFPQRNRLIAALGLGTLVVEAAMRSGSLITARMALDIGREVFAVPGSIHAMQSHGCHWLIRQGAKLVETAQDVLEELRCQHPALQFSEDSTVEGADAVTFSPDTTTASHPVLEHMGFTPISLDALQVHCGLDTPNLQATLLRLELQGTVARLPGGLFQRLGPVT